MNKWIDIALKCLDRSLNPVPVELNELDWKSGLSSNTDRLAKHLSAFANNPGGGFLAFGFSNNGTAAPLSKPEIDEVIQKLGNIARNNLIPSIGISHEVVEYLLNPVLFIHIPEHTDKPVHLRSGDLTESFKRSAGQTVKMTKSEVKQLISISSGFEFEELIAVHNWDSDEVIKGLDYDSYFRLQEKRLPDTKNGILNALATDELLKKSGTNWDVTNLGALLFARKFELFKSLKRKTVRVIIYDGTSRINALKEQTGGLGYASGFEGLINYLMNQLPTNEIIESALRKKVKIYPEVAIREFVANALIHQDLSVTGSGVMIEIFSDRIEITNPGIPLVDVNRFIDTAPKSRNEILASLMRRLNICEERGSGVDRAIDAIETFQLPAPRILKGEDYTRVIVYAPVQLSRMNTEDRVRACYQHTCLHYVNSQVVNNQSIRKRFNIPVNNTSFASKIIAETLDAKLIKPSDPTSASKKYASYVPYWA